MKIFLIIIFSVFSLFVSAQNSSECKSIVKGIIQKQNIAPPTKNKEVFFLDISVNTTTKDINSSEEYINNDRFKLYISNKQTHILSNSMSYYSDSEQAFIIDHVNKVISWIDVIDIRSNKDATLEKFNILLQQQEEVLSASKVLICKDINTEDGADKLIVIKPSEEHMNLYQINYVAYTIDMDLQKFSKIKIRYNKNHQFIKEVEYIYYTMDFDYWSSYPMKTNIENYVFEKNTVFLSKYRSYELIDSRNNN